MTQNGEIIENSLDKGTEKGNKFLKEISELKKEYNKFLIRILDLSEEKLEEFEIDLDIFSDKKKYEEFNKKLFGIMNGRKQDILEIIEKDKYILTLIGYDPLDYNDEISEYFLMEFIRYYINDIFREIDKNNRLINSFK